MNIKIEHIAIAVLLLAVMGVITLPGFQTQPTLTTQIITQPTITCDSTVTPDIDINAYDIDNPTTAITDSYMMYRKKSPIEGAWTTWTLGTAITGKDYGATYEFFMPLDTTISNSRAKAFCKYITWTAPCKETTEMKIYCANDETSGGISNSSFDADGTSNSIEDFAAGNIQTIALQFKTGAADEYYGHPYLTSYPMLSDNGNHRRQYPNILCLKLNSTAWQKPVEVYLDDGTTMNRIANPTISAADGATTHNMYCYEAPVITDRQQKIYLTLEADGTAANQPSPGANNGDAFLYAGSLYINTDTGEVEWGVEDNDASYTAGDGDAKEVYLPVN